MIEYIRNSKDVNKKYNEIIINVNNLYGTSFRFVDENEENNERCIMFYDHFLKFADFFENKFNLSFKCDDFLLDVLNEYIKIINKEIQTQGA